MPGCGVSLVTPISSLACGCTSSPACGVIGGHTFTKLLSTEAVASTPSAPNDAKCSGGFCTHHKTRVDILVWTSDIENGVY